MWYLLSRIDFIDLFEIEQLTKDNERRLGKLVLGAIRTGHEELAADSITQYIEDVKNRICESNGLADSSIILHIIAQHDVNAFALPGRHLVVYSHLLAYCQSPEELAGVLSHEIAHIENRHVMHKLAKEVGVMMLMTIAGGESGSTILKETARILSSTAFDRDQESQADASAVQYMAKAGIDPEHLATLLFRLSRENATMPEYLEFLSTHPNASDRAAEIMRLRKSQEFTPRPISSDSEWTSLQQRVAQAGE